MTRPILFLLLALCSSASAQIYTARSLGGPDKANIVEMHTSSTGEVIVRTPFRTYLLLAGQDTFAVHDGTFWDHDRLAADSNGNIFGLINGEIQRLSSDRQSWEDVITPFPSKQPTAKIAIDRSGSIYATLGNAIALIKDGVVVDRDTLPTAGAIRETFAVADTLIAITNTRIYAQVNDGAWVLFDSLPSTATAIDHSPYGYVVGTATSGIYILDHIGAEWRFISDDQPDWQINDVLYHNGRIYSANLNNVYVTSDLGETWIEGGARIRTMPVTVLARHNDVIYAGTGREGLFRSLDHGVSWSAFNGGIAESQVTAIYEYKGDIYTGSEINAVHRLSSNGSWTDQHNGIRAGATITAFTDRNDTLYALDDRSGLYKWSADSNAWIKKPLTFTVSSEYMDMEWLDERTLVVVSESVHLLDVETNSFTRSGFGEHQIYDLEIADDKMYIAMSDGLRVSDDRGETWRVLRNGGVRAVHVFGQTIIVRNSGNDLYRSDDGGETWQKFADDMENSQRVGDRLFASKDNTLVVTDLQSEWKPVLSDVFSLDRIYQAPSGRLLAGLNSSGLFELTPTADAGSHQVEAEAAVVYPNPASDFANIVTEAERVEICDQAGRVVANFERPAGSGSVTSGSVRVDTSELSAGVYMVKLSRDGAVQVARLVVSR